LLYLKIKTKKLNKKFKQKPFEQKSCDDFSVGRSMLFARATLRIVIPQRKMPARDWFKSRRTIHQPLSQPVNSYLNNAFEAIMR